MKQLAILRELAAGSGFAVLVLYAGGITPLGRFILEITAFVLAVTVIAEWIRTGHTAVPGWKAVMAVGLFVLYLFVRALVPEPSAEALEEALYWLTGLALYIALVHHYRDRQVLERSIVLMAAIALLAAGIGLVVRFPGEGAPASGPGLWQLSGTFVNRNHFALLLLSLIPVTYYAGVAFRSAASSAGRLWERPGFLFLLASSLLMAFFLTGSLGGFMAMCVAGVTVGLDFILHRTSSSARRIVEVIAGIALILMLTAVWFGSDSFTMRLARAATIQEPSALERIEMWKSALGMLADHPVTGIGPGQFAAWFPSHRPAGILYRVDHVHNDLLQIVTETGIVGALLLVLTSALFFLHVFSARNEIRSIYDRAMVRGGTVAIVAVFVHSLVDFGLRIPANAFAAIAVLACIMASASHRQSDEAERLRAHGWKRFALATVPVLGLLLFGYLSVTRLLAATHERRARTLMGNPEEAIGYLDLAVRIGPLPFARREALRAGLLEKMIPASAGDTEITGRQTAIREIIGAYDLALTLDPRSATYRRQRARWKAEAGLPDAARADLVEAVELSPHDWRPLYALALFDWRQGNFGDALLSFGLLLKERPELTGSVLPVIAGDPLKDRERLLRLYPVIRQTFPQTARFQTVFGDLLRRFNVPGQAREQYELASIAEPENPHHLIRLAETLKSLGDYNGAIHRLDAFHQHSPGTPETYELRGDLSRLNQEVADAVSAYRKALELEPDRHQTWQKLYNAYVEFQADPGVAFWQELTARFPDRPPYRYSYAQALARSLSTIGDAIREMRIVASREPANWTYADYLASLHIRRRLHEEARRVWTDYAVNVPGDPRPYEAIARMYDSLKLKDRADEARALAEQTRQRSRKP
ncbi:MAG: O-antigen ligase family protein [Deltaproteobacteria bacterium]|nr:O-antigen ligase family protein [Deltaproteobacteria bacterium]